MAEDFIPRSPKPTRAQIHAVFGRDPDFARKVERIFDDLITAAEAANANARLIESLQMARPTQPVGLEALASRITELEARLDAAERRARAYEPLLQRVNELQYLVAGA